MAEFGDLILIVEDQISKVVFGTWLPVPVRQFIPVDSQVVLVRTVQPRTAANRKIHTIWHTTAGQGYVITVEEDEHARKVWQHAQQAWNTRSPDADRLTILQGYKLSNTVLYECAALMTVEVTHEYGNITP